MNDPSKSLDQNRRDAAADLMEMCGNYAVPPEEVEAACNAASAAYTAGVVVDRWTKNTPGADHDRLHALVSQTARFPIVQEG